MDFHTIKNIRRLNKILITLIRYGFGGLVAEMKVLPFISTVERIFVSRKKTEGLSVPVRIRMVLEELGPTFIKLGQIASTRADILPSEWVEEFKKLQDMVPPVSFDEVKGVIEGSLKTPLDQRFSSFDKEPVASASIAQVHLAVLRDGTEVAVKVKRPGIDRIIGSDISVMRTLAGILEKYVPASRRYRPMEVVDEFARVIETEQDLSKEGAAMDRFTRIFADEPGVQIPKVYWKQTTPEVLTMERIHGTPIDEAETLRARGVDVHKAAIRGVELFFKQVFDHGIFHADLHPGNIFIRDDGAVIYLDFGIVGTIDRNLRKYLASILFHLVRKDYYRMALVHRQMGLIGPEADLSEFEETLKEITEPIYGRTLEEINISSLLMRLLQTARKFDMTLQPNLLLLQKSMVIIEGVGRQLYPDVNMWEVAKPLVYRWMVREKLSPKKLMEKASQSVEEIADAACELPVNANDLMKKTLREDLKVGFVHHRLESVTESLDNIGRSVAGGVIVASIVLAATLVALFSGEGRTSLLGLPVVSWIGFFIAFVAGIRVVGTGRDRGRGRR